MRELTDQKDSAKAPGLFWTKELQVGAREAQEPEFQTLPAQSPQKVVSKTYGSCQFVVEEGLGVETDDLQVLEVSVNVASALKLRERPSPGARVGVAVIDVTWDLVSREEVDADRIRVPQSGVNTASDRVEAVAVSVGLTGVD